MISVVAFLGSFELAVLRMSRYFDLSQNCVLYADTMLPQDAFFTTETAEMKLVTCVFEFAKGVAELKLTETELALYSACVLLSAGLCGSYFMYNLSLKNRLPWLRFLWFSSDTPGKCPDATFNWTITASFQNFFQLIIR